MTDSASDDEPPRWRYRLLNFRSAIAAFTEAVAESRERPSSNAVKGGVVQAFEFTLELGCKLLIDVLRDADLSFAGTKPAIRQAAEIGLIRTAQDWLDAVDLRNRTLHIYKRELLEEAYAAAVNRFYPLFIALEETLAVRERHD